MCQNLDLYLLMGQRILTIVQTKHISRKGVIASMLKEVTEQKKEEHHKNLQVNILQLLREMTLDFQVRNY